MSEHAPAWPIYRRLLGYGWRYWPLLTAASVGMVFEALAGGAFVQLMDPLVNRGFVSPEPRMAVLLPLAIIGLFILSSVSGIRFGRLAWAAIPFVLLLIAALLVLTFVPRLTLWLPDLLLPVNS